MDILIHVGIQALDILVCCMNVEIEMMTGIQVADKY
ncbi:hypothetical protein MEG1DRAFT_02428 [Photorhabdus temperata subsp. temperata Meg1]|uniref:Uncharacterized protein n=1 Tax=Photorhabdus temperata subsp. temperata Meg1 TaxID=1393735 RepID=A0A081RW18_PHOTE|nr:hypothetical protein MEG1DRAFT_02428 [Photorhabdus temperata subsp. temperata Meg1]